MPLYTGYQRYATNDKFSDKGHVADEKPKMRPDEQHNHPGWLTSSNAEAGVLSLLHNRDSSQQHLRQHGQQAEAGGRYGQLDRGDRQAFARYRDSYTQAGYEQRQGCGYEYSGLDYGGGSGVYWQSQEGQAVYPTAPANQSYYDYQGFYGHEQQYAPFYVQPIYQPYQPYQQYGGYWPTQPLLTQTWNAVTGAPTSDLNPNSAPFQPRRQPSRYANSNFNPKANDPAFFTGTTPTLAQQAIQAQDGVYTPTNPRRNPTRLARAVRQPHPANAASLPPSQPLAHTRARESVAFDLPIRTPPRSPQQPRLNLLKRPEPAWTYLKQANSSPRRATTPRSLLVVLDLNGTLLHRKHHGRSNPFIARPRVAEFLHYLLANHKLLIWTSARPENAKIMCERLFDEEQRAQLVGIWGRDKLRLTPDQYNQRVQVYKQLSWVWKDHLVQASASGHADEEWGQENTVLIDDSVEKAASEPCNLLKIDEFEGKAEQREVDVLGQVVRYLEALRWERDVSAYMRTEPFFYEKDAPAFDWMEIVNEMH